MIEQIQSARGIAAVFVTMNRCEIAEACLEKLKAQTRRPEKVIVVDNASTDLTGEMLRKANVDSDGWIEEIHLDENLGNAGGMQIAMDLAFSRGFEAVWILDDDSWPETDALASLLNEKIPEVAVRSCRVLNLATGALSWPLQISDPKGWRIVDGHDPLPDGNLIRIRRSWLGALIPHSIYVAVGPVEGRLFLRGEDEDYPRRIEQAGYPVYLVKSSILHHPPSGKMNYWDIAGRTVALECGLSGDKLYYRLRNAWWIVRRDRGNLEAVTFAALHLLALWRWEHSLVAWLPVWWEAAHDALTDRLGKRRTKPR